MDDLSILVFRARKLLFKIVLHRYKDFQILNHKSIIVDQLVMDSDEYWDSNLRES
jgi:hypothetical protein